MDAALVAVKDREIFGTALLRGISEMSVSSSLGAGMRGAGTLLFIYSKSIRNRGEIVISGFLCGFASARLIAC